jgi:hypothetical protein
VLCGSNSPPVRDDCVTKQRNCGEDEHADDHDAGDAPNVCRPAGLGVDDLARHEGL